MKIDDLQYSIKEECNRFRNGPIKPTFWFELENNNSINQTLTNIRRFMRNMEN